MYNLPILVRRVAEEDTGIVVLERVKRMAGHNLLRPPFRLCEANLGEVRIISGADNVAHVVCLKDGSIFVKQSLIIAKMIRKYCGKRDFD